MNGNLLICWTPVLNTLHHRSIDALTRYLTHW